ncbi:prepilin-type N-terminal cleavage/methylation domain-containing protein [Psychrobacillus sp. NPDC096389]|uniref:prepilin-type N-terminal cleavage/methylation domain-containing protein n=1 Tax=Psychrobacillus sp. NPDC096389 TaxID=3364490 RepID=UPI0037F2085F
MKKMRKLLKNEKGLTLIELLAVIVILAIVAAIAVPAIGNIIENSRVGAIKADAQNAMAGAQLYFTENEDQNTVTVEKLVTDGFLEDAASLEAAKTTTTITKVTSGGGNTINGTGSAGGMTVKFNDATNAEISDHKNSNRDNTGKVVASEGTTSTGE